MSPRPDPYTPPTYPSSRGCDDFALIEQAWAKSIDHRLTFIAKEIEDLRRDEDHRSDTRGRRPDDDFDDQLAAAAELLRHAQAGRRGELRTGETARALLDRAGWYELKEPPE